MNSPLEVWRFRDGKPGHERQTAGLIAALARRRSLNVHDIPVDGAARAGWHWLTRRAPRPDGGSAPALLIGAGRACQWPLLAARRTYGGRAVYCMKPGLPTRWFDLCLVPQHDAARRGPHVEPTFGVLNDVAPGARDRALTLVLIGGPSRHHRWDETQVLDQIRGVLAHRDEEIIITDSRRTPPSTRAALAALTAAGVTYQPAADCAPAWLTDMLAAAQTAWVTADSVSMIFEALTAGLGVGLLDVPVRRRDRLARLAESLVRTGHVTAFSAWQRGEHLAPAVPPIDEAARCADLLLARWTWA